MKHAAAMTITMKGGVWKKGKNKKTIAPDAVVGSGNNLKKENNQPKLHKLFMKHVAAMTITMKGGVQKWKKGKNKKTIAWDAVVVQERILKSKTIN